MRFLKPFIAAVTMALFFTAAPAAHAAGASVVTLNYENLIATSDVGRDMTTKLNQIGQQLQDQLRPEAQAISTEQQSIQQAANGMNEQQLRANAQLTQRIEALQTRANAYRQREITAARDLEYTRQMTIVDFNRQITPYVREAMEAKGANMVLDAAAARFVPEGFDITADVIQRLNQRLRTIDVRRQTAPPPQQQQ
ncbi:MAG: OmpH family outer membrane protein [Hyphomonadaceae bacterium]|nr:OmpH family outer membrane protein [Hyphomonadaceae bacterium]